MTPDQAWARLHAPDVTAAELAQVASEHPMLRPYVAAHPLAYPELLAWLAAFHDPATDAALAARQTPAPVAPPPSPAPTAAAPVAVPVPAPPGAAGVPEVPAPARRRRLGAGAVAGIVAGALVVVGGVTAGAIALTHRGTAATSGTGLVADLLTEPHELWTWESAAGDSVTGLVSVDDSTFAVGWYDDQAAGHLTAVSTKDGAELWSVRTADCDGDGEPAPFAGDGVIGYVDGCSGSMQIAAFDATTGEKRSSVAYDEGRPLGATVAGGTVVVLWEDPNDDYTSHVTGWSVDGLDDSPLWDRDGNASDTDVVWKLCTVGPDLVAAVDEPTPFTQYSSRLQASRCDLDDRIVDLADVTADGRPPFGFGDDGIAYRLADGDFLRTDTTSDPSWEVVDAQGASSSSGTIEPPEGEYAGIATEGGVILRSAVSDGAVSLMRVDPVSGEEAWKATLDLDDQSGGRLATADTLFLATDSGLTWYGLADGGETATADDATGLYSCNVIAGQSVTYFVGDSANGCAADGVVAYSSRDGSRLWSHHVDGGGVFQLGDRLVAMSFGDDGSVGISLLGAK